MLNLFKFHIKRIQTLSQKGFDPIVYQQMCLHPHPLYSIMSLIIRMNILRVYMQASVRFLQVCRVVRILGLYKNHWSILVVLGLLMQGYVILDKGPSI